MVGLHRVAIDNTLFAGRNPRVLDYLNQAVQGSNIQWFDEVSVEAFLLAAAFVDGAAQTAERVHPGSLESIERSQLATDIIAIESWHLDVEKYNIGMNAAGQTDRFASVRTEVNAVPSQLEQLAEGVPRFLIVVRYEHRHTADAPHCGGIIAFAPS
jgi:hypothetical protein